MIEAWRGRLGDEYTNRNVVDSRHVERILKGVMAHGVFWGGVRSVLEVGCNQGTNLLALRVGRTVIGIEPNRLARRRATKKGLLVLDGEAMSLPFEDRVFDLVLSAGLLIHIPPEELDRVLSELIRVSRHCLLTIEYEARRERALPYHSLDPGLWKRPYGRLIREFQPGMRQLRVVGPDRLADSPFEGCTARLWKCR